MKIMTFNVENLDESNDDYNPSLEDRLPTLKSEFMRGDADIICLQEVHGQEREGQPRQLLALEAVLADTPYEHFYRVHTVTSNHEAYDKRNLVILSRFPIVNHGQYRNTHMPKLQYRKVTAIPEEPDARDISWERPILHAELDVNGTRLHVINLHLKSRLSSNIAGQRDGYEWRSAAGWAEGYFLSSVKRIGQALETRILIDKLFDADPGAQIVVCGDFNAEPGEVPVEAIAGRVENTNNPQLRARTLVPCSRSIPDSIRYSHLHFGHGNLLDHMMISQPLVAKFKSATIQNENLHDESLPFAFDTKYPESDHAAFVAEFAL